jgi:hypothetical protein
MFVTFINWRPSNKLRGQKFFVLSSLAQLVERTTVNRDVIGSIPIGRVDTAVSKKKLIMVSSYSIRKHMRNSVVECRSY